MAKHLVFVYGTLRKGGSNDHFLNKAVYIEEKCFAEGQLYDTGFGYPALVVESGKWVTGELYKVTSDDLKRLDRLEDFEENGTNNLYDRIIATIRTTVGEIEALLYIMKKKEKHFLPIPENDWLKYFNK
ncbi:gamma-glutamylcyclotransferase family protein [Fictibacillus sp. b24]|uniref:gamma-glutamylcyclotransferase family protein n=1 Tax=Fictibacillus sp. b24 TaxID=3055863 RepID=UPI0025A2C39C|nr:gamma-glutamylcyclotransferase family protein [Fictibacillus sp. b24]MDM5317473.1 gamma-glutamylcyclotransferase family protein [Fictibacillus sp. b24]